MSNKMFKGIVQRLGRCVSGSNMRIFISLWCMCFKHIFLDDVGHNQDGGTGPLCFWITVFLHSRFLLDDYMSY